MTRVTSPGWLQTEPRQFHSKDIQSQSGGLLQLTGLHSTRFDAIAAASFVTYITEEEKTYKSNCFMSLLHAILLASFHIDQLLDVSVQKSLLEKLMNLCARRPWCRLNSPPGGFHGGRMILMNKSGAQSQSSSDLQPSATGTTAAKTTRQQKASSHHNHR